MRPARLLCVVGIHRWERVLRWEARASIHIQVLGRVCERCRARHRVDERNLAAIRSAWRAAEGGE